ncbi:uncharacterized protein K452DRAFT_85136 [Aplosporella prunicola CBS 121167]|uniref:Uncharacterized protein n=1 Tax=Aplosporella prunicola CBS 121167 TaxID=1176127 RepID=A0A6A6B5C8_9PEZI|nr:uncharacterized protein K452DRAFT_85136 [Aplosporella prunicola CBS 121167]KAF2138838.1 hypothetical protein K452DRAFT_85136 [Aplosporella prunicola CBS 121167]
MTATPIRARRLSVGLSGRSLCTRRPENIHHRQTPPTLDPSLAAIRLFQRQKKKKCACGACPPCLAFPSNHHPAFTLVSQKQNFSQSTLIAPCEALTLRHKPCRCHKKPIELSCTVIVSANNGLFIFQGSCGSFPRPHFPRGAARCCCQHRPRLVPQWFKRGW